MSVIVQQNVHPFTPYNLVASVVKLTAASDTVVLPRMRASSNSVVQLRRPGDSLVTVSQTDFTTVSLTGTVGQEILLISISDDPITNPVS
jgi:hypothetical protein